MSEPMTDAELDEIEARCNAATAGPWDVKTSEEWERCFDFFGSVRDAFVFPVAVEQEDCRFIAASRTDVPRLIAEVRRLRHELAERERTLDSGAAKIAKLEEEVRTLRQIAGSFIELSYGRYKTIDDLRTELNRERSM